MHHHRTLAPINAGSMADIAFLLLIFFLVTTTLDQELGIQTVLPPANSQNTPTPRTDRNVLEILINGADQIMIEGEIVKMSDIRPLLKAFYTNPNNSQDYPSLKRITPELCIAKLKTVSNASANSENNWDSWNLRLEATKLIGPYYELPQTALISLQNDRSTSYAVYILVQNELNAGLNALRNDCSEQNFGLPYGELNEHLPEDQLKIRAIRMAFPRRISEAEPFDIE